MLHTPPGRSGQFASVLGFFLALTSIIVALRIYCRLAIVKAFGWDDTLAAVSMALYLLFTIFAYNGIAHGTGRLYKDIPTHDYPIGMMWWWACEPTYVAVNMALKASIAIFLLRIAIARTHRMILWTTLIVVEIYSLYFLLVFTFQCWPVSHFWNQFRGAKGHCVNSDLTITSFYVYSAISCVADWIFSILPIFLTWNLQMNAKSKMTVGIILAFAAIASSATIVRFPYLKGFRDVGEFLYATIDVAIWSTCETGLGIAASSAATLRPLFRIVFNTSMLDDSSAKKTTKSSFATRSGYRRNGRKLENDDIHLREDVGKSGVVTVVESRMPNKGSGGENGQVAGRTLGRTASNTALRDPHVYLTDGDSEEYRLPSADYDNGIRKTVEVSQC